MIQLTTLKRRPEFYQKLIKLIECAYEYSSSESFEIDFHSLINKKNWDNCYLLIDGSKNDHLVGHIGTKPRQLIYKKISLRCIFIGGIAVDPNYRSLGIFKKFFNILLDKFSTEYEYALLWSEKEEMYEQFNFKKLFFSNLIGNPTRNIKDLKKIGYEQYNYKNLSIKHRKEIAILYSDYVNTNFISIHRSKEDWEELQMIKSAHFFVKKINDEIISYFFQSKGQDLKGIIHEYAIKTGHQNELEKLMDFSILIYKDDNKHNGIKVPTALIKKLCGSNHLENLSKCEHLFISGMDSI